MSHLITDTLLQMSLRKDDLKKPLKVQFAAEEGIDEGGVQKEFMHVVTREVRARARRGTVRTRDE